MRYARKLFKNTKKHNAQKLEKKLRKNINWKIPKMMTRISDIPWCELTKNIYNSIEVILLTAQIIAWYFLIK